MTKGWMLLIVGIAFIAGGFAGFFFAIHMNAETADRYVLYLGSVGEWVSGIGALVAVIVAVLLADKQRKDAAERLLINCDLMIASDATAICDARDVVVEVISAGARPAKIKGVKIWGKAGESGYRIFNVGTAGQGFPIDLNHGETMDIRLQSQRCAEIFEFFEKYHRGDISKARLTVFSTLASWDVDISSQLAKWKLQRDQKLITQT